MTALLDAGPPAVREGAPAPAGAPGPRRRRGARLLTWGIVLWAAFLTAFLALTGKHWWWRPAELMPPLTFLVVPLILLALCPLASPFRLRAAGAALCCLLLGLPLAGLNLHALPGTGSPPPAPPDAVRVFSWNTEYWHDGADPEEFYALLEEQRADVYLLQEHVSWDLPGHRPVPADHVAELRARFPGYHVVAVGELLTMSRYPVEDWRALDNWPHVDDPAGRPPAGSGFPDYYRYKTLRTDLRIGESTVAFYNTHIPVQLDISMDPTTAEFTAFMRAQQIRREATYRALEQDLDGNRLPVVLAGDFNATSAMGELRRISGRLHDAVRAGDQVHPTSWPADGPAMWRLDWAFTSDDVAVHEYRMVPSRGLSDHRGQALVISPDRHRTP